MGTNRDRRIVGALGWLLLASSAWAHDLECEQTVDGQVVRHVDRYPDVLGWEVSVTNLLASETSVVERVQTPQLSAWGFAWATPLPQTLSPLAVAAQSFQVPVNDLDACLALDGDSVSTFYWETGAAQCRARVECHRGGLCMRTPAFGLANSFALLSGGALSASPGYEAFGDAATTRTDGAASFPTSGLQGTLHAGDGDAQVAFRDLEVAYADLTHRPCDFDLTQTPLEGLTLTPGVYCLNGDVRLDGVLSFDAANALDHGWVIRGTGNLIAGPNARIDLKSGAGSCRIYWVSLGQAQLADGAQWLGSVLANGAIQVGSGTLAEGGLFSLQGPLSLGSSRVFRTFCNPVTCAVDGGTR